MSTKAKTRFVATVKGRLRLLLSIRERTDESLLVVIPSASHFENGDGTWTPIKEQRYSVHNVNNAPTNTIKQTIILDGPKLKLIETVNLSSFYTDNNYCHVFTRAHPILDRGRYDVPDRPRDVTITVGEFDPSRNVLVASLILSRAGVELPLHPEASRAVWRDFKRYRVTILTSFISGPSLARGGLNHSMTSQPRLNSGDVAPLQRLPISTQGKDAGIIHGLHNGSCAAAAIELFGRPVAVTRDAI